MINPIDWISSSKICAWPSPLSFFALFLELSSSLHHHHLLLLHPSSIPPDSVCFYLIFTFQSSFDCVLIPLFRLIALLFPILGCAKFEPFKLFPTNFGSFLCNRLPNLRLAFSGAKGIYLPLVGKIDFNFSFSQSSADYQVYLQHWFCSFGWSLVSSYALWIRIFLCGRNVAL